jgi:site-specific recombinase XerD
VLRLDARRFHRLPRQAGGAAGAASEPRPEAEAGGGGGEAKRPLVFPIRLRRGELQYLLGTDTNGRQVFIQGKQLPDGQVWLPKDREARVIAYAGIERPLQVTFGEIAHGYVFSPSPQRDIPYHYDSLTAMVDKQVLRGIGQGLTLHSLRHTFATWRLEQGDSILQVQGLMGHGDANTLLRYAHVQPQPLHDLLKLL